MGDFETHDERGAASDSGASEILKFQQEHSTCDIQEHPWDGVFERGFEAGWLASRDYWRQVNEREIAAARQRLLDRQSMRLLGCLHEPLCQSVRQCAVTDPVGHDHEPECRQARAALDSRREAGLLTAGEVVRLLDEVQRLRRWLTYAAESCTYEYVQMQVYEALSDAAHQYPSPP